MSKKRKISIRKVMQMLVTLVVTGGCVVAISGASRQEIKKTLAGLEIEIKNNKHRFVDEQEVKDLLTGKGELDMTQPLSRLDVGKMEQAIMSNPWVERAQVYIDNKRVLHARVTQRIPVARIFEENGRSYYIDGSMSIMPVSDRYTYYTTIVTGVPRLSQDSVGRSLMAQVAFIVKRIEQDSFWSAQVSQVIMSPDRTFEIVPVLGRQRILLGDTARLDEKLANLFTFYKKVMNRIGWDRYERLDLSFKGQVVASPALQWKVPKDAMDGQKWVETIKAKTAYNKNVFTLDSNNVGVVNRQQAAVASVKPVPTLVVRENSAAHAAKADAKRSPTPVLKKTEKNEAHTASRPAVKKIDPKPKAVAKKETKPVTKKETKREIRKEERKKKKEEKAQAKKKEAVKGKESEQRKAKYLYNSNNH